MKPQQGLIKGKNSEEGNRSNSKADLKQKGLNQLFY